MSAGTVKGFTIRDIFEMLSLAGKTGILSIKSGKQDKQVFFSEGRPFHACSSCSTDHVPRILLSERIISEAQLKEAEADQKITGARLGQVLSAKQVITSEELTIFMKNQMVDELYQMIDVQDVEFTFQGFENDPLSDIGVYLSSEEIVASAINKNQEWKRIKEAIPNSDTVLVLNDDPVNTTEIGFTTFEWKIVVKLTKVRTVGAVVQEMGQKEFEVMKTMLKLIETGLVKKEEFKKAPQVAEKDEKQIIKESVVDINSRKDKNGKYVKVSAEVAAKEMAAKAGTPLEWEPYLTRLDEQAEITKKA